MKTSAILLALLTALPVFAGRIITYTAVSDKSQEEANNAAMAGVAKQIVVQVNSNQTLTKKEAKSKGNSTLDETFFSSNNVKSNLKLKGVKIETIKVSKGYKATASLDMGTSSATSRAARASTTSITPRSCSRPMTRTATSAISRSTSSRSANASRSTTSSPS